MKDMQFRSRTIFCIIISLFIAPSLTMADDLFKCMAEMMQKVSESKMIAELRNQCGKKIKMGQLLLVHSTI